MTTMTALKKVATAVSGIGNAVSNTFAEQAKNLTDVGREAFGNACWEIPKDELDKIADLVAENSTWKGTSSEAARRSEVTTVVKAYPFLGTASAAFKREYGELRREHLVKIARLCPDSATATDAAGRAIEFFETRAKKRGKSKSKKPADTLASSMEHAIDAATEIGNASLAKSLRTLAKKHGIAFA